jgi:hypothetical protein
MLPSCTERYRYEKKSLIRRIIRHDIRARHCEVNYTSGARSVKAHTMDVTAFQEFLPTASLNLLNYTEEEN